MHLGPSAGQWLRPPGASRAARGSGECGRRGWSSRRRGGGQRVQLSVPALRGMAAGVLGMGEGGALHGTRARESTEKVS